VHIAFAVRSRMRFGAEGGVGAEDGRGARGGDEGGVGEGERCWVSYSRCRTGTGFVQSSGALDKVAAGGEVITAAQAMRSGCRRCCGAGRVEDAPGARVERGEWYLQETHSAREEAMKAATVMGKDDGMALAARAGGGEGGGRE
jgi:hypothetical protein